MARQRRFVPGSDMLESRQLLSAAPATPPVAEISADTKSGQEDTVVAPTVKTDNAQSPFESSINGTRQFRIKQLPNYLFLVNTRRKLDRAIVADLQADLQLIANRLSAPPQSLVWQFMKTLRGMVSQQNISPSLSQQLNAQFGAMLSSSGASPEVTAKFQNDMNRLIQADTKAPNPALTAANDYALMSQYVLSVGRKITPNATATPTQTPRSLSSGFMSGPLGGARAM